jgi:hypothetical protein
VIGECWVAEASSRGYVEVFIFPVLNQVAGVQGVLVTLRYELLLCALARRNLRFSRSNSAIRRPSGTSHNRLQRRGRRYGIE